MKLIINNYFNIFITIFFVSSGLTDVFISVSSLFFIFFLIFYKKKINIFNISFILAILFCIQLLLSSYLSEFQNISFPRSIPYIRFIIFICMGIYLIKNLQSKLPINFIIFFLTFLSIDILFQFLFGFDFFGFESINDGNIRNSGFYGDEKIAGSILCDMGMICLVLMKYKNLDKLRPFFFVLLQFFLLISILLTGERMALIRYGTFLLIFNIFYLSSIGLYKKIIFIFLSILIALIFILNNKNLTDKYRDIYYKVFNDQNEIIFFEQGHGLLWKSAYHVFLENKIIGSGPKTFRTSCEINYLNASFNDISYNERRNSICSTHPHNYLFELLSEVGLSGTLLFFFAMFFFYKHFVQINYMFLPVLIKFFPLFITNSYFHNYYAILICFMLILSTLRIKN